MILSSVGYAFLSNPGKDAPVTPHETGSGGVQNQGNGVWTASVYGATFQFFTDPTQIGNISVMTNGTFADLVASPINYDTQSPGLGQALQETVGQVVLIQPVCVGPCTQNVPEKECSSRIVLWNQTASENRVYSDRQCIVIEGGRAAFDAWMYHLTGLA